MKKAILSLSLATALGAASMSAAAIPSFSLGGFTGDVEIKYSNFESFDGALDAGTENYGVVKITSIVDANTSSTLWSDGQDGAELTGVFNGIKIKTVTPSGGQFVIDSTGGKLNLYINPLGSFASAGGFAQGAVTGYTDVGGGCVAKMLCYDGISNAAGGGLFLSLAWTAVGVVADPTITVDGTFNSLTTPLTGSAQGYLNVIGGPYAGMFNSNGQLGGSDMFNQNSVCTPGQIGCVSLSAAGGAPAAGGWALRSNDPLRVTVIPEPGTLMLVGLSLLALVARGNRRV